MTHGGYRATSGHTARAAFINHQLEAAGSRAAAILRQRAASRAVQMSSGRVSPVRGGWELI